MPVREAQKRIDAREFAEWQAFYSLEPFGDEWRQTARIVAWLAASATKKWRDEEGFMPGKPRSKNPVESPRVQMMNLRLQDRARAARAAKRKQAT